MTASRLRIRTAVLGVLGLGLAGLCVGAWIASDRVEQENDFCLGCHLTPEVRLHEAIGRDFAHRPPASLAALHAKVGVEGREDEGFRCIDCHGGTSWPGRFRVKLLAARDALLYAVGRFGEPAGMTWILPEEDCRKCHTGFDETVSEASDPRFHERFDHNENLGVACVECHRVHDTGVDPEAFFLRASHVRAQCARCHSEFQEEG